MTFLTPNPLQPSLSVQTKKKKTSKHAYSIFTITRKKILQRGSFFKLYESRGFYVLF